MIKHLNEVYKVRSGWRAEWSGDKKVVKVRLFWDRRLAEVLDFKIILPVKDIVLFCEVSARWKDS